MCICVCVCGFVCLLLSFVQLNDLVQINTAKPASVAVKDGVRIQLNSYRLCSGLKCSDLAQDCSLRKPVKPSYWLHPDRNTFVVAVAVYGLPKTVLSFSTPVECVI